MLTANRIVKSWEGSGGGKGVKVKQVSNIRSVITLLPGGVA